jgi:uncharacterized protein YeaC (DUF1315 family)
MVTSFYTFFSQLFLPATLQNVMLWQYTQNSIKLKNSIETYGAFISLVTNLTSKWKTEARLI